MLGGIYTSAKCPTCGKNYHFDENRDGMFCSNGHPETSYYGRCRVHFKGTKLRFDTVRAARQKLDFLRVQKRDGNYDPRDYQKDQPLGFDTLANKWLDFRAKNAKGRALSGSTLQNYRNYMAVAIRYFGGKNVKHLIEHPGEIEDFLYSIDGISEKTRHNYKSCLSTFLKWVCRRERLPMPMFPEVPYELRVRRITDWETQGAVIEKIREMTIENPKIVFGIELLASYTKLRPEDLLRLKEGDIQDGTITLWRPTKVKNKVKTIRLIPEHWSTFQKLKKAFPALPGMPFFRHVGGIKGVAADRPFGEKYLYKKWVAAAEAIGLEGVPLYPGTRHTTATEQSRRFGHDAARGQLGNTSNKSIERYIQAEEDGALDIVTATVSARRGELVELSREFPTPKAVDGSD